MYATALMIETYRRRRIIPLAHVLFGAAYALLFVLSWYTDAPPVGGYIFLASGMFLPLVLSVGIFGSDIASGRFRVLSTEPIPLYAFYAWRLAGMVLQAVIQVTAVVLVAFAMHAAFGKCNLAHLGRWLFVTLMMFVSMAAFSTTVSVAVKAESNSLLVFLLLPAFVFLSILHRVAADPFWAEVCEWPLTVGRYALPPVELLFRAADEPKPWPEVLGACLHAAGLTLIYAVAGVALLERRQYKPQRS